MLIAHISICLDCFPFYLLRICSLFCVFKNKCELYNSISESHHCNISDVYILIFFFYRELAMTVLAMRFCHHSPPCPLQISWICSICDLPPSPYLAMTKISGRQLCQWTTTVTVKSLLTHVFLLLCTHTYV